MPRSQHFSRCLQREVADIHCVNVRTVRRWTYLGMPRNADRTYDAAATIAWRCERSVMRAAALGQVYV